MTSLHHETMSFTFMVAMLNHEKYIIEHLESIKFLVLKYGKNIHVDLVINDDASTDRTVELVNFWLKENGGLFNKVTTLYNKKNIGTCKSVINMCKATHTKYAKLTAGDDVYSFENIFEIAQLTSLETPIVYCYPLNIIESEIIKNNKDIIQIISSDVIYRNKENMIDRFIFPSNNNAPNAFINLECLKDENLLQFLSDFDVVEDKPICIKIAENYPHSKIQHVNHVMTYYRRTPGSTYIVANNRFNIDQINIFNYLISSSNSIFYKLVSKSRLYCFQLKNRFFKTILNLGLWYYLINFIYRTPVIFFNFFKLDLQESIHSLHYKFIAEKANCFLRDLKNNDSVENI